MSRSIGRKLTLQKEQLIAGSGEGSFDSEGPRYQPSPFRLSWNQASKVTEFIPLTRTGLFCGGFLLHSAGDKRITGSLCFYRMVYTQ